MNINSVKEGALNFSTSVGSEYCPDRNLRAMVWDADVTRCSMYQEKSLQVSVTLEQIRDRRIKQAQRLGYKHYAEMSMKTKMAGNLDNLYNTLETLRDTGTCFVQFIDEIYKIE